jgi:VIT family
MPSGWARRARRDLRSQRAAAETAHTVAKELTEHDALAAHVDAELSIDPEDLTNPWQAAASALAFTVGAILPLLAILLPPPVLRVPVTVVVVLIALGVAGWTGARIGGGRRVAAVARVVVGGGLGLAITYLIGHLFGTAIGWPSRRSAAISCGCSPSAVPGRSALRFATSWPPSRRTGSTGRPGWGG